MDVKLRRFRRRSLILRPEETISERAERVDQLLSWKRSDQGVLRRWRISCARLGRRRAVRLSGFRHRGLRQLSEPYVSHVIISNGRWAFDHDGWTPLPELLRATAEYEPHPSWESLPITSTLGQFCAAHNSRMPEQYAHDPLPRARRYLQQRPRPPKVV